MLPKRTDVYECNHIHQHLFVLLALFHHVCDLVLTICT